MAKKTLYIDTMLNNKYKARFSLQYVKNDQNQDSAILTAPYVKWLEADKPVILNRVYELSGKELSFVEQNYFNTQNLSIPVKGYPYPVKMEDVLHQILPPKIYNKMINNTFEIDEKADPYYKRLFENNTPQKIFTNALKHLEMNASVELHEKDYFKYIYPDYLKNEPYHFSLYKGKNKDEMLLHTPLTTNIIKTPEELTGGVHAFYKIENKTDRIFAETAEKSVCALHNNSHFKTLFPNIKTPLYLTTMEQVKKTYPSQSYREWPLHRFNIIFNKGGKPHCKEIEHTKYAFMNAVNLLYSNKEIANTESIDKFEKKHTLKNKTGKQNAR